MIVKMCLMVLISITGSVLSTEQHSGYEDADELLSRLEDQNIMLLATYRNECILN